MTKPTPTPLSELAARLRGLEKEATPGPLKVTGVRMEDGSISVGHEKHRIVIADFTNAASLGDFIKEALGRKTFGSPETAKTQWANANLYVELITNLPTILLALEAVEGMEGALNETLVNLELVERVPMKDPDYGAEVDALGSRIGYGALMSSASASWHAKLKQDGWPTGGAFVAGPCHGTVLKNLEMARAALAKLREARG